MNVAGVPGGHQGSGRGLGVPGGHQGSGAWAWCPGPELVPDGPELVPDRPDRLGSQPGYNQAATPDDHSGQVRGQSVSI